MIPSQLVVPVESICQPLARRLLHSSGSVTTMWLTVAPPAIGGGTALRRAYIGISRLIVDGELTMGGATAPAGCAPVMPSPVSRTMIATTTEIGRLPDSAFPMSQS